MINLTSRKLAATVATLVALVTIVGFATFGDNPVPEYEKTLMAVTAVGLGAVGVQGGIDLANKKPE